MTKRDLNKILDCVDSLAIAICDAKGDFSHAQRKMYESAVRTLKKAGAVSSRDRRTPGTDRGRGLDRRASRGGRDDGMDHVIPKTKLGIRLAAFVDGIRLAAAERECSRLKEKYESARRYAAGCKELARQSSLWIPLP